MNLLQEKILDIYKTVSCICDQLGLRYFAIGGTAIGAVRHKGFIPWDDDMDIAMPVPDYDVFVEEASKMLPHYYSIRTTGDNEKIAAIFTKVIDDRTTCIEPSECLFKESYKGVWLDIMPLPGVPSGYAGFRFSKKVELLNIASQCLRLPFSSFHSKGRIAWIACAPFRPFIKPSSVTHRWYAELRRFPYDESPQTGFGWWLPFTKLLFPREWFSEMVPAVFEDTTVFLPNGFEDYLRQQFGNYMELPPVDSRHSHKIFVDLNHPYKDYVSGLRMIPEDFF